MQPPEPAPATKADLRDALSAYATKDDLRAYATKDDLRDALKEFARTITAEMRELVRPIQIIVAKHEGEMHEVRAELKAIRSDMVTKDQFGSRMDGFAGLLLDSRQRWATHADTLVKHDERLKKLEHPTA